MTFEDYWEYRGFNESPEMLPFKNWMKEAYDDGYTEGFNDNEPLEEDEYDKQLSMRSRASPDES